MRAQFTTCFTRIGSHLESCAGLAGALPSHLHDADLHPDHGACEVISSAAQE
jgi:hypothetical protein